MQRPMVRIALVALIVWAGTGAAYAQRMQMTAEQRTQMLQDSLSLSKAQRDSVLKIFEAADAERAEAFQSNSGDRQAMMETMRGIGEKTDKAIAALLTDDQKTRFEQMKKNRPQRGQGFRRRPND